MWRAHAQKNTIRSYAHYARVPRKKYFHSRIIATSEKTLWRFYYSADIKSEGVSIYRHSCLTL